MVGGLTGSGVGVGLTGSGVGVGLTGSGVGVGLTGSGVGVGLTGSGVGLTGSGVGEGEVAGVEEHPHVIEISPGDTFPLNSPSSPSSKQRAHPPFSSI